MTGFGRFSVNEARKIINNFSVAPFVYSLIFIFIKITFTLKKKASLNKYRQIKSEFATFS